jgi:glycosyltransferase involved in cell wall biosynthesis
VKILFVNLSALKFTVQTPELQPLGGSESALCYLARALARRGHKVSLTANLPDGEGGTIAGVRHFPIAAIKEAVFFAAEKFDVIILCNAPAAAVPLKALSLYARLVFWAHVLPDQPSMQILAQGQGAQVREVIDHAVFVSAWQRGQAERAFGAFRSSEVIGNGIAPAFETMFASAADLLGCKQNRAAYTTTPYRGLSVLLRAFEGWDRGTKLDLYSSMRVYQAADDEYVPLFRRAEQNPDIQCHGSVTQSELARQLRRSAFLFYPCIYPETYCITAAEALAAGMTVVTTRLGALEETTMGFADLVALRSHDGDILVRDFREAMQQAVDQFAADPETWAQERFTQSRRVNETATWALRAEAWERLLEFRA